MPAVKKNNELKIMKDTLVDHGYPSKQVDSMAPNDITEAYKDIMNTVTLLDNAEVENTSNLIEEQTKSMEIVESDTLPQKTDPGWTQYILSLLDPETEMVKKQPKTDGLRRIADLKFGIASLKTNVIESPCEANGWRSVVVVTIKFFDGTEADGAADVCPANTDKNFAVYATAVAETRAEGRALRKALRLVKVLTAEEIEGKITEEPIHKTEELAPKSMITSLKVVADRMKVDLEEMTTKEFQKPLDKISKDEGGKLMNLLSKVSRGDIIKDK